MDPSPVPLEEVIANDELARRPARLIDHGSEQQALGSLAESFAGSPRRVLQQLSDTAVELCRAHSAGISLLEADGERRIFRWHAVSGQWSSYLWNTLPREFSPCGTVLDRKAAQFMVLPERHFTPLARISPRVAEVLLIPFSTRGEIVGTVWIVSHDESCCFDGEDQRIVSKLAEFAALAYESLSSLSDADVLQLARLSSGRRLMRRVGDRPLQRRVLVVDDNADAADTMALLIRLMGHQAYIAHGARAGLEVARTVRPDLVLLDISMPEMSGHEVARQMRQFLRPEVRIVAVTGYGRDEDRRRSAEVGFDQHVVKPIDPELLKSLLG